MRAFVYFLNLFMFGGFLWSVVEVSENPAPLFIGTLVLSTIGLVAMFIDHCYNYEV